MNGLVRGLRRWGTVAILAGAVAVPALGGGGFGGGGFQMNPQQVQQMVLGNVQQQVGFTDDEWAIVSPKLWKVVGLQVQAGTGNLGGLGRMMRGRRGGGGGIGGAGFNLNGIMAQIFNNGQPIPVLQRQQELSDVLDRPDATAREIADKLGEYRAAVTKAKADLARAQAELTGVLTLRQEAMLMELGYIE